MTLAHVAIHHRSQLAELARSWLASEAKAFSVWEDGRLLASWPDGVSPTRHFLSAEIRVGNRPLGELRVAAAASRVNRLRLQAEANLIGSLAALPQNGSRPIPRQPESDDQFQFLYQMMHTAPRGVRLDILLKHLTRHVASRLEASGAFLFVQLETGRECWIEHGQLPDTRLWLYSNARLLEAEGSPFLHVEPPVADASGKFSSLLVLAMPGRGIAKAVLGLINKGDRHFSQEDESLLLTWAEPIRLHIERAILYRAQLVRRELETELQLAQHIQVRLLPHDIPQVAGLDIYAITNPAAGVSGDFYDFISTSDANFTFTVCDISGKGMPAALMMAMTRMVVRTVARRLPVPLPAAVVSETNARLYEDLTRVNMFATMFIGQYAPEERVLFYANAGHSPVIYCPDGGEAQLLQADATPIGVVPTSSAGNQRVRLDTGDVLVVGTDGLSESRNGQGEMFGYNHLLHLVTSNADRSATEIGEAICDAVTTFAQNGPLEDDQTLVVCKGV